MTNLHSGFLLLFGAFSFLNCSTEGRRLYGRAISRAFHNYNKNEPPKLDGTTYTMIGMYINNIDLHHETGKMRLNMYLRMSWQDGRLQAMFNGSSEEYQTVMLGNNQIESAWIPDVFIRNADSSEKVDSVTREHIFRVNRTGHVWYVIRVVTTINCPDLLKGMASTKCPVYIESFSYTMDELASLWMKSPVNVNRELPGVRQKLSDVSLHNCSQAYAIGSFSCLRIDLLFNHTLTEATFEAGIYLVSIILVTISWLGFWLPPTEKRVFLGLLVTMILGIFYVALAEWRQFSYANRTSQAQGWLIFCLVLTLAMVLEFTIVYILCGVVRARLRALWGGVPQVDDLDANRSKCADIADTVCGLIVFPLIFIIALIVFSLTGIGFK